MHVKYVWYETNLYTSILNCYFSILGANVEYMLNCNWPTQSKYIIINNKINKSQVG